MSSFRAWKVGSLVVKVQVTSDLNLYFWLGFESFQGRIFLFQTGLPILERYSQMWHLIGGFNMLLWCILLFFISLSDLSFISFKVAHYCKVHHIGQINRESRETHLPENRYNWKTNSGMNVKVGDIIQYYAYKILDVLD